MSERREVNYRGRVQGVGFRYTCQRLAASFSVTGFVRNLSDGSVELIVEGDAEEIERFLAEIQRMMRDYIDAAPAARLKATGQFSSFDIRH